MVIDMYVSCHNANIVNMERPEQGIRDLKKAGFDSLATGLYSEVPMKKCCAPAFRLCRENGIRISLLYAPSADPEDIGEDYRALIGEYISFCGREGVKYLLIQPIQGKESAQAWERNHDFYSGIAKEAQKCNVRILLKNRYKIIGGHLVRGVCAEPFEAAEWVDRLNAEAGADTFGFCMDAGICNLCGNDMYEFAAMLGRRIKAVIVRDSDGHNDMAMLPFSLAQTDWTGLIRGLREIGYDDELIVNFSGTANAFSPLLRPTLFRLGKETGDYFRWQIQLEQNLKKYGSIVLFGAGNMCRNYMKCYGEKYPPLFTCDNNPRLWGISFCGLEVKNPEALKELPEDCGVYICNVYYREIESQLKEMGVRNIEYFNDEYMPTFYFDRLEREEE